MNKFLFLFIFTLACKATHTQSSTSKSSLPVITMKRTECHGTCPVYTIIVHDDKQVKLIGERFLDLIGTYEADISENEYNKLIESFEQADFFSFKSKYTANIADLSTTYLSFSQAKKGKLVIDHHNAPKSLKALEKQVAALVKSLNWQKIE